jgi:starch phosphorylase
VSAKRTSTRIHPIRHRGGDIAEIKSAILAKLMFAVGKDPAAATDRDWFVAAALAVRVPRKLGSD